MKFAISILTFVLTLGFYTTTPAQEKLPTEVTKPYKAYRAALTAKDEKEALKHAKAAWKAAEEHLGDHKTTGDLASNYALIKVDEDRSSDQINAAIRAMDLSSFYGEDANSINMERGVSCLLYTSPSPRDLSTSRMPSSA